VPCAVGRDALSGWGSNSPGAPAYAPDEQEDSPGQEKGFDDVFYKL